MTRDDKAAGVSEGVGWDSTDVHPWKQLLKRFMNELSPDVFRNIMFILGDKLSNKPSLADIKDTVDLNYDAHTLNMKLFFEALEDQYGQDQMIELLRNVLTVEPVCVIDSDRSVSFAELIEDYAKLLEKYRAKKRSQGLIVDTIFLGREKYVLQIQQELKQPSRTVKGLLICGMYGMGKTSLANHVCLQLGEYTTHRMDFKNLNTVEGAYFKILTALGHPPAPEQEVDSRILHDTVKEIDIDTILFLDNVDDLLDISTLNKPRSEKFIRDIIEPILTVHNPKVKLLMTSRYKLVIKEMVVNFQQRAQRLDGKLVELELLEMEAKTCVDIIKAIAAHAEQCLGYGWLLHMAQKLGCNPMGITMFASYIKQVGENIASHVDDIALMKVLEQGGMNALTATVQNVFNLLTPQWRQRLLELSVFDATFNVKAARAVWGEDTIPSTLLDLRYLKSCHLISLDDYYSRLGDDEVQDVNIYANESEHVQISLHSITKQFLQEETQECPEIIADATERFYTYVEGELVSIGKIAAERSILQAHTKADDMSSHIHKCLNSKDFISRLDHTTTRKAIYDTDCWYSVLERFMTTCNRVTFFRNRADTAKEKNLHEYIHCKLWEGDQYFMSCQYSKIADILHIVEEKIQGEEFSKASDMVQKALWAKYHYVNGRYLGICRKNFSKAIKELKQTMDLYREIGHTGMFLARTLNMLGSIYYDMDDYTNAIKYHEEAYQTMLSVMPSGHHFDMPTYVLNVGTAYHLKGNQIKKRANELLMPDQVSDKDQQENKHLMKEVNQLYEKALRYYDDSLSLYHKLQYYGFTHTANTLRSKAIVLSHLSHYDQAIPIAIESLQIFKKYEGMENLRYFEGCYLLGSIYFYKALRQPPPDTDAGHRPTWQEAADAFEESVKSLIQLKEFSFDNPYYSRLKKEYPETLENLGKGKEANRAARIFLDFEAKRSCTPDGYRTRNVLTDSEDTSSEEEPPVEEQIVQQTINDTPPFGEGSVAKPVWESPEDSLTGGSSVDGPTMEAVQDGDDQDVALDLADWNCHML